MNLLLTSIGKRIELTEHLKSRFRVIGVDASSENAAKYFVDSFYRVPRCLEKGYVEALLSICKRERVSMLIPLYEPEFMVLDKARKHFEEAGVTLVLSERSVLDICNDKSRTAAFFERNRISAPRTLSEREVRERLDKGDGTYPLVVKPADGMGSANIFFAKDKEELSFFYSHVDKALVQECAVGKEYTIDVLCSLSGEPVYIVPRIRLEVRDGEVTKSRVDRQSLVIEETKRLLAALQKEGGVKGPMTIQCFLAEDKKTLQFLEINPRFGGGVPLAFAAGADYAAVLEKMGEQVRSKRSFDMTVFQRKEIKELTMYRYTQAVYEETGQAKEEK